MKRTTKSTVYEYDEEGRVVKETITEYECDDNGIIFPYHYPYPSYPYYPYTITCSAVTAGSTSWGGT